ncbi:hypothetical protein I5Q34_34200 [Streptomyces sp. AV19]|uniref:hypothetical protein n=1 Tax=Streptomyces sp. AV19 TaxID=2793068 RepID=UPI0018FE0A44|nr:hypothetical protein [Streptomyces sp. AV19]MBH1939253.1 hypothetical protein [Streptomyces sp. AV19]MDG4531646.1 hypothetical protein [Streptomyces sp. AV19]
MTDTTIRVGQVYVACHPLDEGRRIRITEYEGYSDARVVDADTGKRPRWILTAQLHASATTRQGKPRRSGYALEQETAAPQPADEAIEATTPVAEQSSASTDLDQVLRIVAAWCAGANDGDDVDADDLAWQLERAGYPLPDIPEDDEDRAPDQ